MFHYFCASQHHFLLSSALLLLLLAVLPPPPRPAEVEAGAIRGRPSPKHPARRGGTPARAQRVRGGNTKKLFFWRACFANAFLLAYRRSRIPRRTLPSRTRTTGATPPQRPGPSRSPKSPTRTRTRAETRRRPRTNRLPPRRKVTVTAREKKMLMKTSFPPREWREKWERYNRHILYL